MTVRIRVTLIAAAAVAVVLLVVGIVLVTSQRSSLEDHLDDTLSAEAERIARVLERGDDAITSVFDDDDDDRVVIVSENGQVVDRAGDREVVGDLSADVASESDVTLDGERYRVAVESFDVASGEGRVVVAESRDDIDDSVSDLTSTLTWIIPAALVVLCCVVWLTVRRTLRPVDRMRAEVAGIGMTELDRRVPEPNGNDEIARLAVTMNEMLERLQRAVSAQQRFVADASHELRTPLTRMRTELEVDERHPDRADPGRTRRSQLDEIDGLQRMIEDLLTLARGDAGHDRVRRDLVDLDDIVLAETKAIAGGPTIDASGVSAAQVMGDRAALVRVVRNLLDNARRHARSTIRVSLGEIDGRARLVIDDDGPGVPVDQRVAIFDRFARLDASRSVATGQSGLGLAIVADIVARHGGTITVEDAGIGGARFVVSLAGASPS